MSEIAVRNQPLAQIRAALSEESLAQLEAVLPEDVSPSKFLQVANTAALINPDLVKADRASLFVALMKCATAGLLPDGEEAAIVAYGGKAQFLPMIGGFRKIAADFGWDLRGYVVYEHDEFDYQLGDHPWVKHVPPKLGTDRGQRIGAYAVATHRDGRKKLEVMDAAQVLAIKARAKNKQMWNGPDEARMWEKTPGKSLFKRGSLGVGVKETDRIRALLDETDLGDDRIAALYGKPRPELAAAVPPDPTAGATESGDGTPQAAPSSDPPEGGAAPGSFDWDSVDTPDQPAEAEPKDTPEQQPVETRAQSAGAAEIPGGKYAGKTIAQVAQVDEGWLLRMLHQAAPSEPTRMAIEIYVRGDHPDLWGRYLEEKRAGDEAGLAAFGDAA